MSLSFQSTHPQPNALQHSSPSNQYKIFLSDIVVTTPARSVLGERSWNYADFISVFTVMSMHILSLFAPFFFTWKALYVGVALGVVTGCLGITLAYHRCLAHRSFKLPKWLEYTFAYCGVLALQGDPIRWVNVHRYHHQFTDTERDPHSPLEGFWFSHMTWIFDNTGFKERKTGVSTRFKAADLEREFFYRFMRRSYGVHPFALGLLLYALGGFPFIAWGMGVRTICLYHVTWLVNSACHVWGKRAWNTPDLSRNTWWVAILTYGEGWHNNHHAFEYSARHGLEWWQLDVTWYVIWFLQALGLATDVKFPTEAHKQKWALKTKNG